MIKINYNGYEVEVQSVAELKELVGSTPLQALSNLTGSVANKPRRGRPVGSLSRRRRSTRKASWETVEVNHIISAISIGKNSSEVSRDPLLRERHVKSGILQMYYNVKNNITGRGRVSPEIAQLINDFHSTTKIPFNKKLTRTCV